MQYLFQVLQYFYPTCKWSLTGSDYSGLVWLDENTPEPSEDTLIAQQATFVANMATIQYKMLREAAYPDLAAQLDMLWHSMDSGEIPKSVAFYNARAAVKTEYPKPTNPIPGCTP